jgi:hypothetical protein
MEQGVDSAYSPPGDQRKRSETVPDTLISFGVGRVELQVEGSRLDGLLLPPVRRARLSVKVSAIRKSIISPANHPR